MLTIYRYIKCLEQINNLSTQTTKLSTYERSTASYDIWSFDLAAVATHIIISAILSVLECGPIVNVEDALVYGNRREVGSKLKYVCKNRPMQSIVECGIDGNWTKMPDCKGKCIKVKLRRSFQK